MRTDQRQQAIAMLADIWELSSDVRLGQLLSHIGFLCNARLSQNIATIEDDELIGVLQQHRAELQARLLGETGTSLNTM